MGTIYRILTYEKKYDRTHIQSNTKYYVYLFSSFKMVHVKKNLEKIAMLNKDKFEVYLVIEHRVDQDNEYVKLEFNIKLVNVKNTILIIGK